MAGMPGLALLPAHRSLPSHRAVSTASAVRGARGDRRAEGASTGRVFRTAWPALGGDCAAVCASPVPPVAGHLRPCADIARAATAADVARAPGAPTAPGDRATAAPGHGRPALG